MSLTTYVKKRNFKNTPEPGGKIKKHPGALTFVVQRHDASHLHYDFRLEMDGVLKSWAIPKGPSMNPGDKRLAVMVEDHPLKYGGFAGVIPAGNYGAGTVEIWDAGTYEPEEKTADPEKELLKQLAKGSVKFILHGEQLNGSFALVALKNSPKNWLLIKHKDEYAVTKYSIEEHRSISEKAGTKAKGKGKAKSNATAGTDTVKSQKSKSLRYASERVGEFIKPMLASLGEKPFDDEDWVFEIKWDGYRAVAELSKKDVRLYSRNGISFAAAYPSVVEALLKLKLNAVLDGEVVALDADGKPDFQALQNQGQGNAHLVYYVFDCLSVNGKDITHLSLLERKLHLRKLLSKDNDVIRYSDHVDGSGIEFFGKVVERGLEGMMAKRGSSTYLKGARSHDWLKIKNQNTQEAIIAGFTAPRNSRKHFGALVLGVYKGKKLTFIGHTGTGFTDKVLKSVYDTLKPLIRKDSPFKEKIPMKEKVTWVDPKQVCTVKFSELTKEGILRHPVFMGLRVDKSAREVDSIDKPLSKETMDKFSKPGVKRRSPVKNDAIVTHADKIFWPDEKITKGDVIAYYQSISKYILPHLKDRPQSLKRTPNGIAEKGFFHKDAAGQAPDFVEHVKLYSEGAKKDIDYILCNNESTLTYLNNLGCIEINPWNSRINSLDNPDFLILDIDPSDENSFDQVVDTAKVIQGILKKAGATGYPKTSGATGMHVFIPLHAMYTYDQIRIFAEGLASLVVEQLPDFTTTERSLAKRGKKIYVDYLQNKRGQTLSSVYSLRPVPGATVSMPLEWKEVKHGLLPTDFTIFNSAKRVTNKGDLFAPVLKERIDLIKCIKRLGF